MKQRVSIVLDTETLKLVEEALKDKAFRNRSHAIELMINQVLKKEKEAGK